jgi:hypothetical protein
MRELSMTLRHPLLAAALVGALAAPSALLATSAGAATTTQVWVTNAYTYAAGNAMDWTLCLDGSPLASLSTTETSGPTTVNTGAHEIEAYSALDADCADKPDFTQNIDIPEGAGATIAIWWPYDESATVSVFAEDMSCVQSGTGEVTLRNLAAYSSGDGADLSATAPGGGTATVVNNVGQGEQATDTSPVGTYTDAAAVVTGTTDQLTEGTIASLDVSETTRKVVYTYGGVDGAIGLFTVDMPSTACEQPTTSAPGTTAAPTTTAAPGVAPVATAITKQPTFTG